MDMEWFYLYIISQMETGAVLSQKEIDMIFLKINFPKEIDCISSHYRIIDMITHENIYEFLENRIYNNYPEVSFSDFHKFYYKHNNLHDSKIYLNV